MAGLCPGEGVTVGRTQSDHHARGWVLAELSLLDKLRPNDP